MKAEELKRKIASGAFDGVFATLYGEGKTLAQRERYTECIDEFTQIYDGDRDLRVFSVSGRSEISGNHTDHNHGKVLAASIDLDIIAVVAKSEGDVVRVKSSGYTMDTVRLSCLDPQKYYKSASMIAGVCDGLRSAGYTAGGFDAYTTSNVFKASGLSSSAAFEDMIGTIENHLYNDGRIDNVEIAKIGQYAENKFYGKPCGLLDQVACIYGGFVYIDFENPSEPEVEQINFDPEKYGYDLCIVNTGGNHADLTDDYAAIPEEMKAVASFFGKDVLRTVSADDIIENSAALREKLGDRALLRALHYINENGRVERQREALRSGDIDAFLAGVTASGNSSFKYLQNVYPASNPSEQGLSLALAIAEQVLRGRGASRVHGGGFAGTVQVFCPKDCTDSLKKAMEAAFGEGACVVLKIRPYGGLAVDEAAGL